MPDAFFVSNKSRKRKRSTKDSASASGPSSINGKGRPFNRTNAKGKGKATAAEPKSKRRDEELESDATQDDDVGGIDDLDLRVSDEDPGASGDEDELETPAEKRLRLATLYLQSVKEGLADGEFDAAEIDKELISSRLKQDVLEHSGKIHRFIAESLDLSNPVYLRTKGHKLPVTSAVASSSAKYLFTAGKDGAIVKWDLHTGKRISTFHKLRKKESLVKGKGKQKASAYYSDELQGHVDEILALAISDDGRYLASGGKDRRVIIWDAEKDVFVKSFGGHKDSISALAFRKNSLQLFSASYDRTVKIFDLDVMGYVETLFGHQDFVLDIDVLRGESAVSAGARDRTVRFWKVVDETQLVFRGGAKSAVREVLEGGLGDLEDPDATDTVRPKERVESKNFVEGSIDCVAMIDETTFVSGGDSGSICIWTTQKKKPQYTQAVAHGMHEVDSETEGVISTPKWITALAAVRYSDLIASGSWGDEIRLWKLDVKPYSLTLIGTLPASGFVNSLQLLLIPQPVYENFDWVKRTKDKSIVHHSSAMIGRLRDSAGPDEDIPQKGLPRNSFSDTNILVIASLGQEPRLGRWMHLNSGVVNSSRVHLLRSQVS